MTVKPLRVRNAVNFKWSEVAGQDFQRWLVPYFQSRHLQFYSTKPTSTSKNVKVQIDDVPIRGIVDTGSDITIFNGTASSTN